MSDHAGAPVPNRKYLTVGMCGASFVYGFIIALLGVVEKPLGDALQLTPEQTSNFALFINFPLLVMLFGTGILLEKAGKKLMIAGGSLLVGLALLGIGSLNTYALIGMAMAIMGIGGGFINGGNNTMIHDLYPENPARALNLVNMFFGVGAIFLPFVAAALLTNLGLQGITMMAFILCLVPAVLLGLGKFPPPGISEKFSLEAVKKALSNILVLLFAAVMFFYVALEISTGMWSNRFFQVAHGVSESTALYYVSGYWTALFIGRIISARLLQSIAGSKLLIFAAIGSCIGLALMAASANTFMAVLGLWLTGLCYAPMFPTTLGTAGPLFKDAIGTVFGVTIGIGIIGAMVLPKIIGNQWNDAAPSGAIWFIFLFAVMQLLAQTLVHRQVSKKQAGV